MLAIEHPDDGVLNTHPDDDIPFTAGDVLVVIGGIEQLTTMREQFARGK